MMSDTQLFEHDTRGNYFTWSNKQVQGLIYSRIDRAICNREWFMRYPDYDIEVLQAHISDHSPIRILMQGCQPRTQHIQARFHFMNNIVEKPELLEVVRISWN